MLNSTATRGSSIPKSRDLHPGGGGTGHLTAVDAGHYLPERGRADAVDGEVAEERERHFAGRRERARQPAYFGRY